MASYKYTARDAAGSELAGTYTHVASVAALRQELKKLGYVLIRAEPQRDTATSFGPVRARDVVTFACKFAGMYSAGLPVLRCLQTLEQQTTHRAMKATLVDVRRRVETGSSLKRAFEPHRKVFTDFFLGMVEAGESAGRLSQAKTRAAFVYPLVVGFVCCIVVTCLLIFVVPTFSQLYTRLHVDIPGPTRALLTLSSVLRHRWWALLATAAVVPLGLRWLMRHSGAKMYWHRLRSRLPLVGPWDAHLGGGPDHRRPGGGRQRGGQRGNLARHGRFAARHARGPARGRIVGRPRWPRANRPASFPKCSSRAPTCWTRISTG